MHIFWMLLVFSYFAIHTLPFSQFRKFAFPVLEFPTPWFDVMSDDDFRKSPKINYTKEDR